MNKIVQNHVQVPVDDNEAFIPSYDIDDEDPTKLWFKKGVSPGVLYKLHINRLDIVHDATYCLNWTGFPVYFVVNFALLLGYIECRHYFLT